MVVRSRATQVNRAQLLLLASGPPLARFGGENGRDLLHRLRGLHPLRIHFIGIPKNGRIPLAKSGQAARAAKREVRVAARGTARNQATKRSRLIAAAVATCCKWVLASPR